MSDSKHFNSAVGDWRDDFRLIDYAFAPLCDAAFEEVLAVFLDEWTPNERVTRPLRHPLGADFVPVPEIIPAIVALEDNTDPEKPEVLVGVMVPMTRKDALALFGRKEDEDNE